jgi:hypothetical protein
MLTSSHAAVHESVVELLTTCIFESPRAGWPGTDGMTLEDVVSCYRAEAAVGHVPSAAELCDRHPELAGELAAFFDQFQTAAG